MQDILELIELLDSAIKDNPDNSITAGEIIADGYDEVVDSYRETIAKAHSWLSDYQENIAKVNNISKLKVKYTGSAGYFIEIPKSQTSKIPENFIHKQTLVNAARYVTMELKEFEEKFFTAQNQKAEKEYEIFQEIREKVLDKYVLIKDYSELTAYIDFLSNLAYIAYQNNYYEPIVTKTGTLKIHQARHPVVEKGVSEFVSNDISMSNKEYIHIITGPNMGGKSTFLRQNAVIILMAHIGSYVPAAKAEIPLIDKIFSRVGASDNLFLGQSTFMVEMQEVANILHNATENSFIIIDEVGRGTSTYDGMSLAWAILKELHEKIKAKTLFATHYHELIDESKKLSGVKNFSLAVGENDENLVFLRKVVPGGMKKSYGLEVAKIAGIPSQTIKEARNMLAKLEDEHNRTFGGQLQIGQTAVQEKIIYKNKYPKIISRLHNIDINNLTPLEALKELAKLKDHL